MKIGILPHSTSTNPYLHLSCEALNSVGAEIVPCSYNSVLPISSIVRDMNLDALIIEWAHSFYTSKNLGRTLTKSFLGELDRRIIRKRKIPIIWNIHNLHRHDKKFRLIEKYNFKKLIYEVDAVRVFHKGALNIIEEYFQIVFDKEVLIAPQGNYIEYYNNSITRKQARKKLSVPESDLILLIFGGIRKGKGIVEFTRSFINADVDNTRLLIAGPIIDKSVGDEISNIIKMNSRITLFNNYIPDNQVQDYFNASDLFVIPYENILNSGAAILGMSFGKPILANDIPSLKFILSSKFTTFFNLSDSNELREILLDTSIHNLEKKGQIAKSHAMTFDWKYSANKIFNLLNDLKTRKY